MKTKEETKKEVKEKLIKDAEFDVNYHTEKLAEAKLKLEAVKELK